MINETEVHVRATRIIYGALLLGSLMFGIVVLILTTQGLFEPSDSEDLEIVSWMAVLTLAVTAPVAFAVRGSMLQRAKSHAETRLDGLRGASIVYAATLEGACLFNLVAWLITGNMVLNASAAFVAWGLMLAGFPSASQIDESL